MNHLPLQSHLVKMIVLQNSRYGKLLCEFPLMPMVGILKLISLGLKMPLFSFEYFFVNLGGPKYPKPPTNHIFQKWVNVMN